MFSTEVIAATHSTGDRNTSNAVFGWYKRQKPFVRLVLPIAILLILAKMILPLFFAPPSSKNAPAVNANPTNHEEISINLKDTDKKEEQVSAAQHLPSSENTQSVASEPQKNEDEQYLMNRKRVLIGTVPPGSLAIDILGVENQVLISGSPYIEGAIIKDGFRISQIKAIPGERIEDIKFEVEFSDIKSGKVVKKSLILLSDHYNVLYYEGGLELKAKNSTRTSGVVLEGENISSAFRFTRVKENESGNIYYILLPGGEEMEVFVPVLELNV